MDRNELKDAIAKLGTTAARNGEYSIAACLFRLADAIAKGKEQQISDILARQGDEAQ